MTRKRSSLKNDYFLVLGSFVVLAGITLGIGVVRFQRWEAINGHLESASGIITQSDRPHMKGQRVKYSFAYGGKRFFGAEEGNHFNGPTEVGESVTVEFSNLDPTISTLDLGYLKNSALGFFGGTLLYGALGGLCAAAARRTASRRRALNG